MDGMLICKRCSKEFSRSVGEVNRGRTKYCGRECSDMAKKEDAKVTAEKVQKAGKKQCKMCHKTRVLSKFPKKGTVTGYYSYCYECKRAVNKVQDVRRKYSVTRKAWSRKAYLLRTYKLTVEEYETMEKSQEGGCAICGSVTRLAIDHCHSTGKVRGLLCYNCNRGLGMFSDNKERLTSAISYLK